MNPLDSFYAMFGTTGMIALALSLFFGGVALMNAWRRRRLTTPPPPKAGPILMSDPHSGTPVGNRLPPPPAVPPPKPPPAPLLNPEPRPPSPREEKPPAVESKTAAPKAGQFFRQLDARGVDMEASRSGKHEDYQWE